MTEHLPKEQKAEPMTLTNLRGTEFEISIDKDGDGDFLIGITPARGDAEWMYIDKVQAAALRNWLNKALPT